jgi:EmrB/QacA subfamily drug resistance transporter
VPGTQTQPAAPARYGAAFAVLGSACLFYSLMQSNVPPVLRQIEIQLDTSAAAAAWIVTSFMLTSVVAIPILGRFGDMFGKRRLMLVCLALILAGLVVSSVAGSIEGVIAGRVIQGLGGAVFPLSFGLARDAFPREKVAGAVAMLAGTVGVGGGLGVVISGVIVDHLSVRWLFIVPAIGVAVTLVGAILFLPESDVRARGTVDVLGALLIATGLLTLLLGITQGPAWGWGSGRVLGLFAAAAVLLTAWVLVEERVASPLVDMRMMRRRPIWTANVAAFMFGYGMYSTFMLIPFMLQQPASSGYGLGESATRAALYLAPSQALMMLMSPLSGRLAARRGARIPLAMGAACAVAGFAFLVVRHDTTVDVLVGAVMMGLGLGLGWPAMANAVVAAVTPDETGVATGMNTIARTIGGSVGTTAAAAMLAATTGASGIPGENGFQIGYGVAACSLLVTLLTTLAMPALGGRRLAPSTT